MSETKIIWGDGVTDDTAAIQHYVDGGRCVNPDGSEFPGRRHNKTYIISNAICVHPPGCTFCAWCGFGGGK